jgi:hypothetical protein
MHASRGVLRRFNSRDNNVAIVLSTLVIAVLFQLLRQGIQQSIDLGFYRGKYDAERLRQPSTPPCARKWTWTGCVVKGLSTRSLFNKKPFEGKNSLMQSSLKVTKCEHG